MDTINGSLVAGGFGGIGGWDEGARILRLDATIVGIEIDEKTCTAAVAADTPA